MQFPSSVGPRSRRRLAYGGTPRLSPLSLCWYPRNAPHPHPGGIFVPCIRLLTFYLTQVGCIQIVGRRRFRLDRTASAPLPRHHSLAMVATIVSNADNGLEHALQSRRLEMAAKPGIQGLIKNARSTAICFFASLGGLCYGYNQGQFGQILSMKSSFGLASGVVGIQDPTFSAFVTAILELGAWVGVLAQGILADSLGRKLSVVLSVLVFTIGVIVQACSHDGIQAYILGGRFVTGLGVGGLSMVVPLYNAELAPPETRGALVSVQQLAITFGIMIAYWITYGTNFIGGTGQGQSDAAWLIPITIQLAPALLLGIGMLFMPQSPRWLMMRGREEETLKVLSGLRGLSRDHTLVQMEFLELKAQNLFEKRISEHDHPDIQNSPFRLAVAGYKSLVSTKPNFRRTSVAVLTMVFQQWTGVNFILYYAPFIFASLHLSGNSTSLLASGLTGVAMFLATIPAVLYADRIGRKPLLIVGAVMMGCCHFIVAAIIAQCSDNWEAHKAAGWVAVVFIWLFAVAFGFSWGPCAWVVIAEVFPLGLRAKGVSIGASSNWLNNFAVGMSTLDFVTAAPYGAYIFLGLMCFFGVLYIFFFVPETKNKTLDEIAADFGDNSGRSKMETEMLQQAYADVGLLRVADVDATVPVAPGSDKASDVDEKQ